MSQNINDVRSDAGTSDDELTEAHFLEAYKKKEYPKPSLTADIVVFRRLDERASVLLVRRGKHPFRGCWALPGGFANPNEDVIDAAQRELEEETGVTGVSVELFGVYGTPGRDPRGWTVSNGFCALLDDDTEARAGDDAADARWCTVEWAASCQPVTAQGDGLQQGSVQHKSSQGAHEISVKCSAEEVLSVRFIPVPQRFGAPRARVVGSDGFAFDHAQIFADAYLKVAHETALL